jgi:hypothetical protein
MGLCCCPSKKCDKSDKSDKSPLSYRPGHQGPGLSRVVSCFVKLSKLLNQEIAWAHPACTAVSAHCGEQECRGQAYSVTSIVTLRFATPYSSPGLWRLSPLFHQGAQISNLINLSILPLSSVTLLFAAPKRPFGWLAADARAERANATPSRALMARGLRR